MTNVINSNEQMIEKINEVLQNRKMRQLILSSYDITEKNKLQHFSKANFDTILNGSAGREQILGALNTFKQIWFNEKVSVDYKEELLASLQYVYKEHSPEF